MNNQNEYIDKLTPEIIEKYLKNELSDRAMHEVEKLMLHYDFEAEAMEGFESMDAGLIESDIKSLNKKLDAKINKSKNRGFGFYLKIAASLVLIAVSTFLVIKLVESPVSTSEISQAEPESPQNELIETKQPSQEITAIPEDQEVGKKEKTAAQQPMEQSNEILPETKKVEDKAALEDTTPDIEVDNLKGIAMAEERQGEVLLDRDVDKVPDQVQLEEALQGKAAGVNVETASPATKRMKASRKAEAPAANQAYKNFANNKLRGTVTSVEDGSPLPGVNVVVKGTTIGTVTDLDGNYSINVPQGTDSTLVFSFIGLATTNVDAAGRNYLDVQMNSDVQQLSEVVVTGYGVVQEDNTYESTFEPAQPAISKSDYKDYLERNIRYPANRDEKGRVVVKFKVNANGTLSDFEIKKSMGQIFDNEALRLIKEGPKWKPAKRDEQPVEDYVKVRVKFEPEE